MAWKPFAASTRLTVAPDPPKSHTATVPPFGRPGFSPRAKSAAVESGSRANRPRDHSDTRLRATRTESTATASQYAGWVTATASGSGRPSVAVYARARSASATKVSLRCVLLSAAATPAGSPARPTKSLITNPGSSSFGFSVGTPTSGARRLYSVSTGLRVTARSAVTAARLVAPIDRPNADPSPSAISSHPAHRHQLIARAAAARQPPSPALASANRADPRDQRQVQRRDPAWRQVVDGRVRVERPQSGGQATGRGGVAS